LFLFEISPSFLHEKESPKLLTIALMLSHPFPHPPVSGARHRSQSALAASAGDIASFVRRSRTKSTASWHVSTSQMPSQQSSRNSSPGSSVTVERSGAQVTACLFLTGGGGGEEEGF
jgi:hypothetical protein